MSFQNDHVRDGALSRLRCQDRDGGCTVLQSEGLSSCGQAEGQRVGAQGSLEKTHHSPSQPGLHVGVT